jgi:hypothetical protein
MMQKLLASLFVLALTGCAAPVPPPAPANAAAPWTPPGIMVTEVVPVKPSLWTLSQATADQLVLRKPPLRDRSRLPLPNDIGFAWDKLDHRGQVRWECRATPSGQFVRQSFCAHLLKLEGLRPASFSDLTGWMGVIYND